MAPSLPQCCAAVSAALEVSHRAAQGSQPLSKTPADLSRGLRSSKIWLFYKSNFVASWILLYNCRCFQKHLRVLLQSLRAHCLAPGGGWEHLEVPRSTGEITRSVWENCVLLPDQFIFCWWSVKNWDGVKKLVSSMPDDQAIGEMEIHTLEDMRWNNNDQCPIQYCSWDIIKSMRTVDGAASLCWAAHLRPSALLWHGYAAEMSV